MALKHIFDSTEVNIFDSTEVQYRILEEIFYLFSNKPVEFTAKSSKSNGKYFQFQKQPQTISFILNRFTINYFKHSSYFHDVIIV